MIFTLRLLVICLFVFPGAGALAQGVTRTTFHDPEKKNVKEIYQVKDTVNNILHGRYVSYFLNGKVDSRGQLHRSSSKVFPAFREARHSGQAHGPVS